VAWTIATSAVAVSVGTRVGVLSTHTHKIKNENARTVVESILSASDACVNVAFDVGDRVVREIKRR
jgi:hypothetical protein